MRGRRAGIGLTLTLTLAAPAAFAAEKALYDWIGVAPIVVVGESLGLNGKATEVRVTHTLRGESLDGQTVRLFLRRTNHERDRELHPRALRLDAGVDYLLLLEERVLRKKKKDPDDDETIYVLARGVRGARELPNEGAEATVAAVRRFVEIQDSKDNRIVWRGLTALLEETDPILIENALEQFLRFRRGKVDHLALVYPLLGHPSELLRERAARLIGQILEDPDDAPLIDADRVRSELISRARRDASVAVRVEATRALGQMAGSAVDDVLEEIAGDDPDQLVRIAAERLILDRASGTGGASSGGPEPPPRAAN